MQGFWQKWFKIYNSNTIEIEIKCNIYILTISYTIFALHSCSCVVLFIIEFKSSTIIIVTYSMKRYTRKQTIQQNRFPQLFKTCINNKSYC